MQEVVLDAATIDHFVLNMLHVEKVNYAVVLLELLSRSGLE